MLSPSQRQENDDLIHCLVISAPHHSRNDGASNRLSILKSPSHKTHLPKTCPKIRKKHMTSTMSGSTHQISPKKRFRNTFLEFSWGSHHQKTPNLSQFPHHIEHRTQRDNLPMPQVSDDFESNEKKTGWIPTIYHGNSMKYLLVFRFTRDSQEQFHNPYFNVVSIVYSILTICPGKNIICPLAQGEASLPQKWYGFIIKHPCSLHSFIVWKRKLVSTI